MNVLLLIKSDINLISIEDCKTRAEFFAYTIKSLLPDYINVVIQNCNRNINNAQYDYIIYINETGFYYESNQFIKNIKNIKNSNKDCKIISFGLSNKFYTFEDIMFGITQNITNTKYTYLYPPLDADLYISRTTDYFCIFFDHTQKLYDNQIITICEVMKKLNDINVIICTINTSTINYYNLDLELIETMNFDSYLDYITELSKANLYFVTNICADIYKLYELSMCNIPIVSHELYIPKYIIEELEIYTYPHVNNINWVNVFNKLETFNIRDKLIINDYSWMNVISVITNELNTHIGNPLNINNMNVNANVNANVKTKTLNLNNYTKPSISQKQNIIHDSNVMEKIYNILELSHKEIEQPQRKMLLQSQILNLGH
jgi:hypothetical protein